MRFIWGAKMIGAHFEWDAFLGWHEVPSIGPGPFERAYARQLNERVQAFVNVERFKRDALKEAA